MLEKESEVTLRVDNTPESKALQRIFRNRGVPFSVISERRNEDKVPAVETWLATIPGWHNIKLYLLKPEECELLPEDYE